MGTNYYARVIPTKKRKLELFSLINTDKWNEILEETHKIFDNFHPYNINDPITGVIHLGKRSAGWKFLWNPNIYLIRNGYTYYVYSLNKESIWNFINRPDIEIYDEYGEKQDKKEFFDMAINWITWKGKEAWDSKSYAEYERSKNPNYKDYSSRGEYIDLLLNEGFKMASESNHDFYSDGLRFATTTEFS